MAFRLPIDSQRLPLARGQVIANGELPLLIRRFLRTLQMIRSAMLTLNDSYEFPDSRIETVR
jgi:hypothetical protein